jgi:hypothetical protein
MVELSQSTPFVGEVTGGRKLPVGTEVEVRAIKKGTYGTYALSFVDGQDKPVFLKPGHVDYISDVSAERQAEFDAEKAEWLAGKNAPVEIGPGEPHSGGKAVEIGIEVSLEATDQTSTRRAFFPLSQITEVDGVYSAPPWLARIRAVDTAYYWVSHGGRKGVHHLGGAGITASYASGLSYAISVSDLIEAADREEEGRR